jgi:hypothetical protein
MDAPCLLAAFLTRAGLSSQVQDHSDEPHFGIEAIARKRSSASREYLEEHAPMRARFVQPKKIATDTPKTDYP